MTLLTLNFDCVTHVASTHHSSRLVLRGRTLVRPLFLFGPYPVNLWSLFLCSGCVRVWSWVLILAAGSNRLC